MNDQTPKIFRFDQIEFSAANLLQIVALLVAVGAAWFGFKANLGSVTSEVSIMNSKLARIEKQFVALEKWRLEIEKSMLVQKIHGADRWSASMFRDWISVFEDLNEDINIPSREQFNDIQDRGMSTLQP